MADLVDIGPVVRDPSTNTLKADAKSSQIGDTEDDAPGFDAAPIFGSLGIVAIPWPKDSTGGPQGIVEENLGGQNGIITNIRDLRTAGVVEELGPGETAIYSTGPDFGSKIFLKKKVLALMIDDDIALNIDKENKKLTFTGFGCHFEISEDNGIVLTSGGATSQWKDGMQSHMGQIVLGGRNPLFPLAQMMVPVLVGVAPMSPIVGIGPALGVFIGG